MTEEKAVPPTARRLIDALKVKQDTFVLTIAEIDVTVRMIGDLEILQQYQQDAERFAAMVKTKPSPPFKPYSSLSEKVVANAHFIKSVIVEPEFSDLEILDFAKEAGPAFTSLMAKILEKYSPEIAEKETFEIDKAKND